MIVPEIMMDTSALLTDLYQLNMVQAYVHHGDVGRAVFELFFRKLPPRRGFLLAAGLEQALEFLGSLNFPDEDIKWLARSGHFSPELLDYLSKMRFTGDVHAMPEGTVFFADEPILRISAPLPEAQFVETRLMNILHYQSLVASKAARMKLAAPGKRLVDYGLRRAHGADAGLMAARASYISGFEGTATVLAEKLFGIPIFGTMAHSFIEAHADEMTAFAHFARAGFRDVTLLLDTYDTLAAARKVAKLAPKLQTEGISVNAVRLDSGDLIALSQRVRDILDSAGLQRVKIIASGGLDEDQLLDHRRARAPIDAYGIGTSLATSSDVPSLDCAYKLQEYDGTARRKKSEGKATWPGAKQVWRSYGRDGKMAGDVVSVQDDEQEGQPLLELVMREGRRVGPGPTLSEIRARAAQQLEHMPSELRELKPGATYPVRIGDRLISLAAEVDRIQGQRGDDNDTGAENR